jgi:hypothetical protein
MSDLISNWHYQDSKGQGGPVSAVELKRLHRSRKFPADGLVWHPSLDEWQPLRDVWAVVKDAAATGADADTGPQAANPPESATRTYRVVAADLSEPGLAASTLQTALNEQSADGWVFDKTVGVGSNELLVFYRF